MSIASGSAFGVWEKPLGLGEANIFIVSKVMEERKVKGVGDHLHLIGLPHVLVPYRISPECMVFLGRRFIEGRSYVEVYRFVYRWMEHSDVWNSHFLIAKADEFTCIFNGEGYNVLLY